MRTFEKWHEDFFNRICRDGFVSGDFLDKIKNNKLKIIEMENQWNIIQVIKDISTILLFKSKQCSKTEFYLPFTFIGVQKEYEYIDIYDSMSFQEFYVNLILRNPNYFALHYIFRAGFDFELSKKYLYQIDKRLSGQSSEFFDPHELEPSTCVLIKYRRHLMRYIPED